MILSRCLHNRYMSVQLDTTNSKILPYAAVHANSVRVGGSASSEKQQQQQAFFSLKTRAPICLADIVELQPGYRALIATQNIAAGDIVLELLPCNSLCVPKDCSAYRWECDWLEPFEAAHGGLPDALSYFIADQEVPWLLRLSTLVLCVKKQATNSSSSSSFWHAWLQLLPPLTAATYPGAGWTAAEVRELQFQPYMTLMADKSTRYDKDTAQLSAYLNSHRALRPLKLAENEDEVRWALFIAKTRAVGDNGSLYIHPIHDFLNHDNIEDANCIPRPSNNSFRIVAEGDITAGSELTICYSSPELSCNLNLLLTWGFTAPTWRQEWALPQIFQLLPPISYHAVAAAAAAITLQRCRTPADMMKLSSPDQSQIRYCRMLLAAAASLPLSLSSGSSRNSLEAVIQYANAARLLQKYGLSNPVHRGHHHHQQQQQQDLNEQDSNSNMLDLTAAVHWIEQCVQPGHQQMIQSQAKLLLDIAEATAAIVTAAATQQQHIKQWLGSKLADHTDDDDDRQAEDLHLQKLAAAAVHNECQLLLLQAGTTVQQDEELLHLLKQQQQQQMHSAAAAATDVRSSPSPPPPAAAAAVSMVSGSTQPSSSSSSTPQGRLKRGKGRLFNNKSPAATNITGEAEATSRDRSPEHNVVISSGDGSSSSAVSSIRSRGSIFKTSKAKASAAVTSHGGFAASSSSSSSTLSASSSSSSNLESSFQHNLEQFQQLQQQVVQKLILLQALQVIDSSSNAAPGASAGQQAAAAAVWTMKAAAHKVVEVLGQEGMHNPQGQLTLEIAEAMRQQRALLSHLQQQQQQQLNNSQQKLLVKDRSINSALCQTAVACRLERKKLLAMLSELAKQVENILAGL